MTHGIFSLTRQVFAELIRTASFAAWSRNMRGPATDNQIAHVTEGAD